MRSVLIQEPEPLSDPPWPRRTGACEFCTTRTPRGVRHDLCPGKIQDGAGAKGSVWTCDCHAAGHEVVLP